MKGCGGAGAGSWGSPGAIPGSWQTACPAPPAGAGRELSARHLEALKLARERLAEALEALRSGAALDLVAEGLRAATEALDDIDGRTTPEDVLDRLFARFCIGK